MSKQAITGHETAYQSILHLILSLWKWRARSYQKSLKSALRSLNTYLVAVEDSWNLVMVQIFTDLNVPPDFEKFQYDVYSSGS